jgi:hypothetical protein
VGGEIVIGLKHWFVILTHNRSDIGKGSIAGRREKDAA